MPSPADPARRGSRLTTLYVAIWGVMAVGALAYLIITFAGRPGVLSQIAGGRSPIVTGSIETPAGATAEPSELETVKQSLTTVQSDVEDIKHALGRQDARDREVMTLRSDVTELSNTFALREERERQLSSRLAAVEARQSVVENVASASCTSLQSQAGKEAVEVNTTVTGSVEDPTRRTTAAARTEPKAVAKAEPAQNKPEKTQTASATAAVPEFRAPKVISAQPKTDAISGPVGLQITSADSPDALRLSWLKLTSGHGDIFQNLDVRYRQIPTAKGSVYRLIAGPVADAAEGARMCAELKARKLGCTVASFSGEPL
ncbi:MAG TPA: hypothetical protein VF051_07515 [Hyphomicrobiaceae bacterium]